KGPGSCDPRPLGAYANYATYLDPASPPTMLSAQDPWKPLSIAPITTHQENGISLTTDWTLNDNFSIKSITAYREYESEFAQDTDGTPLGVEMLLQRLEHEQFSQEIRLNGTVANGAVDFTV